MVKLFETWGHAVPNLLGISGVLGLQVGGRVHTGACEALSYIAPQITDLVVFDRRDEFRLSVALALFRFTSLQSLTMDIIEALKLQSTEDYTFKERSWIKVSRLCELPIKIPLSVRSLTIIDALSSEFDFIYTLSDYLNKGCNIGTSLQTVTLCKSHKISTVVDEDIYWANQELDSAVAAKGITLEFKEEIYESLPKLAGCNPG